VNPSRRDALPLWVTLLLVAFAVLFLLQTPLTSKPAHGKPHQPADQGQDGDAAMQDLIQSDLMAKTAYAVSLAQSSPVVHPDTRYLHQALTAAETLQTETQNSPDAARRVILLRALVKSYDLPTAARRDLAPLAMGKNHLDPLAAFTTALPSDTPPKDRLADAQEGQVWKAVFGGTSLTPDQNVLLADQIRALPQIRWWRWPALSSLSETQGDLAEANRYALEARSAAIFPLVATGLLGFFRLALGLAGILILIYFGFRAFTTTLPNVWPTLPEPVPFSERKLGGGDLMAVFVVYLVSRVVIELLFVGFPGIGHGHLFRLPGLLTPFRAGIKQMAASRRDTLEVVLEAVTYLVSAVPPLVYLWAMARRRGASLAAEIGWTSRSLWPNVAYGIAGYAVATPLMLLAALLAPQLFRHAPAPSNPVIPDMVNASGFWVTALLSGLASLAAPVVEELLFRGVFFQAAKLRLGPWPAIVLTGLVFGLIHPVGVVEKLAIAVLGGVFAWMAETRKSLVPSMTAHCLNNLTSTLILLFALAR
jgi:membrane protease YdiL (CAAX protease family)